MALARAVVRQPNVFLMDEPLSNLDAKLRVSTRAQIKHLQHELAVTTIYVTHDRIEAMTLVEGELTGGAFEAPGMRVDGMPATANGPVVLGFRAEDARFVDTGGQIRAPIYTFELLGDATMVTVRDGRATAAETLAGVEARHDAAARRRAVEVGTPNLPGRRS